MARALQSVSSVALTRLIGADSKAAFVLPCISCQVSDSALSSLALHGTKAARSRPLSMRVQSAPTPAHELRPFPCTDCICVQPLIECLLLTLEVAWEHDRESAALCSARRNSHRAHLTITIERKLVSCLHAFWDCELQLALLHVCVRCRVGRRVDPEHAARLSVAGNCDFRSSSPDDDCHLIAWLGVLRHRDLEGLLRPR